MPWTRPFKFGATKPKAPNRVRKNALINKVEAAIARHQARQRKAAEEAAKQEGVELQDEVNPGAESRLSEWEDITENPFLQDPPSNPFQEQRSRTNMEARQNTANGWERCRPFLVNTFQSGRKACCNGVQAFSRKFEVLLVSFHEAKRVELDSCACLCGAATTLLQMGYFPSAPTHPTIALEVDMLALFRTVLHEGPISKHAFASGLRTHLERKTRSILPDLVKPFYSAYAQWQAVVDTSKDTFLSLLSVESNLDCSMSTCSNNCPACFYRKEHEYSEPLICSVDGVFSHRRLKGGKGREAEFEKLPTFLFDKPGVRLDSADNYVEPEANCGHSFRAAEKPKTLMKFDETGLMGLTCRHGQGIRYIDLYEGERYVYAYRLFKLLQQENPGFSNFGLMYDVGCRFDPYLKEKDLDFWKQSRVAINAMHVYGHPLTCQVTRAPRRQIGFGWSDGETAERDWSSKRHLVPGGKVSSSARRRQILDAHSRNRNEKMIVNLPTYLSKRLRTAKARVVQYRKELQSIFNTPLTVNLYDGSTTIPWSLQFLDEQIASQREFFLKVRDRKKEKKRNLKVFTALKKERDLEEALKRDHERTEDGRRKPMSNKAWVKSTTTRSYPQLVEETDKLLKAAGQTRADWDREGELWRSFAKTKDPEFDIYQSVDREATLSQTINEFRRKTADPATGQLIAGSAADMWVAEQNIALDQLRMATMQKLQKYYFSYDDHCVGSANWKRFKTEELNEKLEGILHELMDQTAKRTAELKALHTQASGQSEARPLLSSLYQKYPKIVALVNDFNHTASQLPDRGSVAVLTASAFMPAIDPDTGEAIEVSEEALWNMEFRQAVEPINYNIWGQSQVVRKAIDFRLRQLRAEEEMSLVVSEAGRLWRWTVDRARAVRNFSQSQHFYPLVCDFAWELFLLVQAWLEKSDMGIFSPEQRSEALGIKQLQRLQNFTC
jgi:hypothetical protein